MQHASQSTHTRAARTLPSPTAVSHGRPRSAAVVLLLLTACLLLGAARTSAQNVQHTKNAPGIGMRSVFKVNPATNALELEVPLGPTGYPQRGGASVAPSINYSSRIWRIAYSGPIMGTTSQQGPPPVVGTRVVPVLTENSRMGWTYSLEAPYIEKTAQDAMGGEVYDAFGNSLSVCKVGGTGDSCCFIDRIRIHMPGGGTQEFRSSDRPHCYDTSGNITPALPTVLYSVDGSRMRFNRAENKLYLPDGSYWVLSASATTPAQFFDRNGNRLLNGFTDGLGRTFPNPLAAGTGTDYTYTVPGAGGAPLTYTFRWRYLDQTLTVPLQPGQQLPNFSDDCGNSQCAEPNLFHSDTGASQPVVMSGGASKINPLVLYQIVLPHDPSDPSPQTYTFTYDAYAEIDKVVYPTGGYERFAYGVVEHQQSGTYAYAEGNRGVTDRFVSARGDGSDEVQWRYAWTDEQGQPHRGEITPAPESTRTERFQYYTTLGITFWSFTDARAGRPTEERVYNSAGQMIRRKLSEWAVTGSDNCSTGAYSTCTATRNPRLSKEVAIIIEPGGQALAKVTTYGYDLNYEHTTGANQTSVSEYDFVAVDQTTAQTGDINSFSPPPDELLRKTETAYLDAANTAYHDRHILGLPTSVTVKDGAGAVAAVSTTAYDEPAYQVVNDYGAVANWTEPGAVRGNATTAGRWLNTTNAYVQGHAKYDQLGNVVVTRDANGNETQTDYSPAFSYAYPTSVTTAAPDPAPVPDPAGGPDFVAGMFGSTSGFTSHTDYDPYTGLVTSTTDINGKTTSYDYSDPLNRLKRVDLPDGGRTSYNYVDAHPCGPFVETRTLLDAAGREISSWQFSDGLGRPYLSESTDGQDASNPYLRVDTRYDTSGRVSQVSAPYRTPGCGAQANPSGRWTTNEYDALGRMKKVTTPDGARVQTEYDGLRVLVTDQADRQRMSRSDGLGRLAEVWEVKADDPQHPDPWLESVTFPERAGVPDVSTGYRTEYGYDVLGNLRTASQPAGAQAGQTRTFVYDSLSRLTSASNPESGTVSYAYDGNGNLTTRTDARGVQTTYAYDGLNRNIITHYAGGGTSTPDVRRHYDQTGAEVNGLGRPWWTEAVGVSATYIGGYDEAGRPKQQTQKFWKGNGWEQAPAYGTGLKYNLAGGVTELTYPSGHTVTYSYDAAGRLGDNGAEPAFKGTLGDAVERTYASQLTYSEFGGLQQERFGTQTPLYHKLHYNRRGQLFDIRLSTVVWATDQWDWNRGAIINYYGGNYAWEGNPTTPAAADNNGNLRRQQTWVPSDEQASVYTYTQQTYEYDALNRLSWVAEAARASDGVVTDSLRQSYDYDRWGNRTVNADGTWLGPLQPAPAPTPTPSELVNEKQFDRGDLQNTNRLYAPGDTALLMGQRQMRYDAAGNLTYDHYTGRGARVYDAENRMTSAADNNNGTTAYAYDGDGRRVRRNVGSAAEVWQVYGMGGELLAEYPKDGPYNQPQKEYGYRGGELLVTAEAASAGWGPAPSFEDNPLNPNHSGETPVRSQHITDLRNAIDSLRRHKNLPDYTWVALAGAGDPVSTAPIVEMRAALDQALGAPAGGYTPGLASRQPILAAHIQELRKRVLDAWQSGAGGTDIRWLVSDQLGTPRMVVDKTGSLAGVKRHDYLPFGEELSAGAGGRATAQGYGAVDNVRQQFTGYERDTEIGLDYAQARYFASVQGRFTSPDPLLSSGRVDNPQTWNRFSYTLNNPLKYTDPHGMFEWFNNNSEEENKRREQFLKAYKELKGLRDKVLEKLGDASEEYKRLDKIIKTIGEPGDGNSVRVAFGKTYDGKAAADTDGPITDFTASKTYDKKNEYFKVTIDLKKTKGDDLVETIGHEGQHVVDLMAGLRKNGGYNTYPTEFNANEVSSFIQEAQGRSVEYEGGGGRIWRKEWANLDRQTIQANRRDAINHFLSTNKYYKNFASPPE